MMFKLVTLLCVTTTLVAGQLLLSDSDVLKQNNMKLFKTDNRNVNLKMLSPGMMSAFSKDNMVRIGSMDGAFDGHSGLFRTGSRLVNLNLVQAIPVESQAQLVTVAAPQTAFITDQGFSGGQFQTADAILLDQPVQLEKAASSSAILIDQPMQASSAINVQSASSEMQPVNAAVNTLRRTVDYIPVAYNGGGESKTQVVNVPPNEQGLHINFVSKSSPLTVSQQHIPGEAGQVQVTESEDEPHRLVHNVKKSVIQEVNEVVQPYRVLKQEVKPVIEQAHTSVARGEGIPLSGQQSGIVGNQAAMSTSRAQAVMFQQQRQQPAIVLGTAQLAQPTVTRAVIAKPELAQITIAQPTVARVAISPLISRSTATIQPRMQMNVGSIGAHQMGLRGHQFVVGKPAAFSSTVQTSKFVNAQPVASFSNSKTILSPQPASSVFSVKNKSTFV